MFQITLIDSHPAALPARSTACVACYSGLLRPRSRDVRVVGSVKNAGELCLCFDDRQGVTGRLYDISLSRNRSGLFLNPHLLVIPDTDPGSHKGTRLYLKTHTASRLSFPNTKVNNHYELGNSMAFSSICIATGSAVLERALCTSVSIGVHSRPNKFHMTLRTDNNFFYDFFPDLIVQFLGYAKSLHMNLMSPGRVFHI